VSATLECELFDQQPAGRFTTRREAKLTVFDYLETFYNPRRSHSALGRIARATFDTLSPPRPEPQTAEARCPRQRVNSTARASPGLCSS
jgi:putative transposase